MKASHRYWLFQIPGLAVAGVVSYILYEWNKISMSTALFIIAVWLVKDIILYPLTVKSYDTASIKTGIQRYVGKQGLAHQALDPEGYILIQTERWKAISLSGDPIPKGTEVIVEKAADMRLYVIPSTHDN